MVRYLGSNLRLVTLLAVLVPAISRAPLSAADPPVPIIFDTDLGNDVDDALALAMLHALESRGECRLLAVTVSKDNRLAAAFADAINRFYGRGKIPVGLVQSRQDPSGQVLSGPTPDAGKFLQLALQRDGREPRYPNRFATGPLPPSATTVLRQTLAHEPDHSVVIVQVGFSTNLARLLDSPPDDSSPLTGGQLVQQKVRLLSVMAGWFAADPITHDQPAAEYNIAQDIAAAQKLAADWPTPIVWSGFEVGRAIEFPAESIDNDFNYVDHHPIAEAYRLYNPPPHNRPTWDLTSALFAVRPTDDYFNLGRPGRVTITSDGHSTFTPEATGPHRLLTVTPAQITRARQTFVELSSQPPTSH